MVDAPMPPATGDWPSCAPDDVGVDPERLRALIEFARSHASTPYRGPDPARAKARLLREVLGPGADTDVVGPFAPPGHVNGLVLRHGFVIAEFGETDHVDEIASATKSFLSLLAGVALDEGRITDVHRSVHDDIGLDLLADPHNRRITWHHLLQQTSEWDGELFDKVPSGHRGERVDEPPHDPGTYWEYNDVRVNMLARCLLELFGRPLPEVLDEAIMQPVGASDRWQWHGYETSWVTLRGREVQSVSGGAHWGGGLWMHARDLARIGLLYLRDGTWGARRLLSSRWIEMTRTPCPLNPMYGYMWWLQHDDAGRQVSFAAQGGGSHQLFVIPDHDLVVVVKWLADDAWPAFLDRALRLVRDRPPLGPVRYRFDEINRR